MALKNEENTKMEEVLSDTPTKTTYSYIDTENNVKLKSREVFKKTDVVVHYPFISRNGKQKYKTIESITFNGFKGKIPAGFLKAVTRGLGFTRELAPLAYELQSIFPKIKHIVITATDKSRILSADTIQFSETDLKNARPQIVALNSKQRDEMNKLSRALLAKFFPGKVATHTPKYPKGELFRIISQYEVNASQLSQDDVEAIKQLFLSISTSRLGDKPEDVVAAKESIDKALTKRVIDDFQKLYARLGDTDNLENAWQEFFSENILYLNFGYTNRFEKERILGDKATNIPDFLLLNHFSYIDIFEIKTHLTQLLSYDKGRKNFYWSGEAARAISQAENYIDSLIKQEDVVIKNIRDEYGGLSIDTVRPSVFVIASSRDALCGSGTEKKYKGKERRKLDNDFRRLNNSLKNIKFVLYDEMLETFQHFLARMSGEFNS